MNEGVIKFDCQWQPSDPPDETYVQVLNSVRTELHDLGFVGVDSDGIGFGNLSLKTKNKSFVITGTQTGKDRVLKPDQTTTVTGYSIQENRITCEGPIKASSESLTHAAIYELSDSVQAILHVHHEASWKKLLNHIPTTEKHIPYGTPEMAQAVKRLYREGALAQTNLLAMSGHQDGLIAFGPDLLTAKNTLLRYV